MAHDWGVKIPAEVPTETVFEIRDKLRSGAIATEFGFTIPDHPKKSIWLQEITSQLLTAYEAEAARRQS